MNEESKEKMMWASRKEVKAYYQKVLGGWDDKAVRKIMNSFNEELDEINDSLANMKKTSEYKDFNHWRGRYCKLSKELIRLTSFEMLTVPKKENPD